MSLSGKVNLKRKLYLKRKIRGRKKISGTNERPRVSVFRSISHIYAQAIDDVNRITLASSGSLDKGLSGQIKDLNKTDAAKVLGKDIGEKLLQKGIKAIVFDRNGFRYHGRVASFAAGIRESGISF